MTSTKTPGAAVNPGSTSSDIDETRVIEYLRQHPDFFRQHPQMLGDLSLPHASQGAASLLEKQVAVLRERSITSRHKLSELIDAAKTNDALFEKIQQFVLSVLTAKTLQETIDITLNEMQDRFDVENTSILILTNEPQQWQSQLQACHIATLSAANNEIPGIVSADKTFCSVLRDTEAKFVFNNVPSKINSAAIALRDLDTNSRLLFCVAHHDSEHYNQHTGTLFVDFIVDILQALITRSMS